MSIKEALRGPGGAVIKLSDQIFFAKTFGYSVRGDFSRGELFLKPPEWGDPSKAPGD
jgi:hypothetical protein